MKDDQRRIEELKEMVGRFAAERDWEQFHSPKNLAASLMIEAAELMELFQWCTVRDSYELLKKKDVRDRVGEELADIAAYLFEFCHLHHFDLSSLFEKKWNKTI
jgi:NTP pyrophosphatase (non-canonical NTP hydrolase)